MNLHEELAAKDALITAQVARIADLERQLAEASAPAVEQQPSCAYCNKGTCYKHEVAPQAATDTDKVREALQTLADASEIFMAGGVVGLRSAIDNARAALSMAAQAPVREVPGWISVKDQLPGIGVDVVVYCGYMVTAQRTNDQHDPENHKGWVLDFDNGRATEITHWLPLPAAPMQQEGASNG